MHNDKQVVAVSKPYATQLASIYPARPDKVIQVAAHPGVKYQDVINAMDIAKSSGVRVIGIAPKESY